MSPDILHCVNEEKGVFRCKSKGVPLVFNARDLGKFLSDYARCKSLTQARICFHNDDSCLLQKMLVYHSKSHRVGIHAHPYKDEYITVLSGRLDIVIYNKGRNDKVSIGGDQAMTSCFIPRGAEHEVVVMKDCVFLEETTGPFRLDATVYI